MENYKEIIKKLEENKTIQDWQLREKQRIEIKNLKEQFNIKNFNDRIERVEFKEEFEKLALKQNEEFKQREYKIVHNTILKNNLKVACYNQLYPLIFELLEKYQGKACGKKTYEKFRDEFYKCTEQMFRISLNNNEISIYPTFTNSYNFLTICTKYDSENKDRLRFLIENKFVALSIDNTYIYNNTYIENIPLYIDSLNNKLQKLEEKKQEFESLLKAYRELTHIDGLKEYNSASYSFKDII